MTNLDQLLELDYETLAHVLYLKGNADGYQKVTDKTKWREPVMASKLGHKAHKAISAGAGSAEYGSDAYDSVRGEYAEYKTTSINDDDEASVRKILGMPSRSGRIVKEATVGGIYNGAYKDSAIEAYSSIAHYFGVFYQEKCILIARIPTPEVIRQLTNNNNNRKPGKSTNLSSVSVPLSKAEIVYDNREYLKKVISL